MWQGPSSFTPMADSAQPTRTFGCFQQMNPPRKLEQLGRTVVVDGGSGQRPWRRGKGGGIDERRMMM